LLAFAFGGLPMAKKTARKSTAKKRATKRSTTKRDLVAPKGNKRFVKRTTKGRFKESDDASRSLSADQRKSARTRTKSGHGDQGDRRSSSKKR
jgi:hypothetical protein